MVNSSKQQIESLADLLALVDRIDSGFEVTVQQLEADDATPVDDVWDVDDLRTFELEKDLKSMQGVPHTAKIDAQQPTGTKS